MGIGGPVGRVAWSAVNYVNAARKVLVGITEILGNARDVQSRSTQKGAGLEPS